MITVVGDFETRSLAIFGKSNKKRGVHNGVDEPSPGSTNSYNYATHPSTEVLCFAYSVDGWPVEVWRPEWENGWWVSHFPFAEEWPDVKLLAHNAEFEWSIWNYCCVPKYGWPRLEPHQIECLAARAAYSGLPRKLDNLGHPLGLGHMAKDKEGHKAMLRCSKPVGARAHGCELVGGKYDTDPTKLAKVEAYCVQDVVTESIVERLCLPLPAKLQELWHVHREVNERGVPVDVDLCRTAVRLVNMENARLAKRLAELTGIEGVTPDDTPKLKTWMFGRFNPGAEWPRTKKGGMVLDKAVVVGALKGEYGPLPDDVKEVLEIRELSADAAVAKYSSILRHQHDGRCRGSHVFYTAGTGRFSGQGVQVQNQRRLDDKVLEDRLRLADYLSSASKLGYSDATLRESLRSYQAGVIPTLAGMVRLAVKARPGHVLVVVDWSAIEYRMLHWLAGDAAELKRIRDFDTGVGVEPYILDAAQMFGVKAADVTKSQRQGGKVFRLGCGYATGAAKYRAFAKGYGIDLDMDAAQEHVQLYRRSNPLVKRLWYALNKAAVDAVSKGGRHRVGYLEYYMTGSTLNCRLPSGRELKYWDAKVVDGMYGPEVEAIDVQKTKKGGSGMLRRAISVPVLTENADSGACFDLMTEALITCRNEGVPVVMHIHDEIVAEVPEKDGERTYKLLTDIMRRTPAWARGLPISTGGGVSVRYTK